MSDGDVKSGPEWDNGETHALVLARFGKHQAQLVTPCLRSMTDRAEFARYHYHEALDLMNGYVEERLAGSNFMAIYDDYDEFSYLMLRIRAHAVACVQSLDSIPDTCAHMLLYCMGLSFLPSAPTGRKITAASVLKLIEIRAAKERPEYLQIHKVFGQLTMGDDFEHLHALCNTLKHRSIIRPGFHEDWSGNRDEKHYLQLEEFEYEGAQFPSVDLRKFLQREHDRIQPLTVDIGCELNRLLKSGVVEAVATPSSGAASLPR